MEQNAYIITELPHKVWHFYETSDHWTGMYLVVGEKRALMIDTGNGTGPLRQLAEEITSFPIDVVCTHGHGDHTGANNQFERAYVHPKDMPMLLRSFQLTDQLVQRRARLLKERHGIEFSDEQKQLPNYLMGPVRGGDVIDLGGRTLEIIEIPGHTPGGIALLDRENRLLFTGDSAGEYTIWAHIGTTISQYRRSMLALKKRAAEFDMLLPAHGNAQVSPAMLDNLIACADDILQNPGVGQMKETFVGEAYQYDAHGASILYKLSKVSRSKKKT